MEKKQVNLYLPAELVSNLKNLADEGMWSLTSTINFILKLYLDNPEMFDFKKRIWTIDKLKATKKELICFQIGIAFKQKILDTKAKDIKDAHFFRAILDVYFVDNPVTSAPEEKKENDIF